MKAKPSGKHKMMLKPTKYGIYRYQKETLFLIDDLNVKVSKTILPYWYSVNQRINEGKAVG